MSEIKFPIMVRIAKYYYAFYGDAMTSVLHDMAKAELDIISKSDDKVGRAILSIFLLVKMHLLAEWIMDDDLRIFLREDHT